LWAKRERRAKRTERVALCRNLMISLGMPSGPGAFEYIPIYHAGEGEGGVTAGFDDVWVGVVWVFSRRDGKLWRGGAG
jgi:hypothetical protein